jgi:hypothetical protein
LGGRELTDKEAQHARQLGLVVNGGFEW